MRIIRLSLRRCVKIKTTTMYARVRNGGTDRGEDRVTILIRAIISFGIRTCERAGLGLKDNGLSFFRSQSTCNSNFPILQGVRQTGGAVADRYTKPYRLWEFVLQVRSNAMGIDERCSYRQFPSHKHPPQLTTYRCAESQRKLSTGQHLFEDALKALNEQPQPQPQPSRHLLLVCTCHVC